MDIYNRHGTAILTVDSESLRGAKLAGANLADANLAGANLADANLAGADLADANLADANLANARLAGSDLADANLAGANLAYANLARVNLADADLAGANLARANLAGADLFGARGIISFGPVGDDRRIGYAVKHDHAIMVQLGCFWGTKAEAVAAIREKYGDGSAYEMFMCAACEYLRQQ